MISSVRSGRPPGDLELLVEVRVLDEHLEHEPVLLGLRQRVGALLLDRVLRRQHEERVGQLVPHPADGHLPLLHGLQQCRLRLGRSAVDLVCQDDVGEQRPLEELELPLPGGAVLLEDFRAGDVGRRQVRGELDAAEVQRQALRQGRDHQRLGQAGDALEDAVAAAEQRD
jgi:hypothetical protein